MLRFHENLKNLLILFMLTLVTLFIYDILIIFNSHVSFMGLCTLALLGFLGRNWYGFASYLLGTIYEETKV